MIKAKGVRGGVPLEVVYTNDRSFLFNGEINEILQYGLDYALSMCFAVGGFYFPHKDSTLNVYNTLQNHYFDGEAELWTDEDVWAHEKEVRR